MRIRTIATATVFAAVTAVCFELFAGMVILKNSYRISGRVLKADDKVVVLGYRHGILAVSRKYVDRVMKVRDLSAYGRELDPPTNEELAALEDLFLKAPAPPAEGEPKRPGRGRQTAFTKDLRTTRHVLKGGNWEFSFDLPARWSKSETTGVLVFSDPQVKDGASVCAAILETPPVDLEEQARLTEAAAKAELDGFSTIYSVTRENLQEKTGECGQLGTCGPEANQIAAWTVLRRTGTHTLALTFFAPVRLYKQYKSVFSICRESLRVRETDK